MLQRRFRDGFEVELGIDRLHLDLAGQGDFGATDADSQIVRVGGAALPHSRRPDDGVEQFWFDMGPLGARSLAVSSGPDLERCRR